MAVSNSLAHVSNKQAIVKYMCNGEEVRLSPQIIRKYLVSGNGAVTDQEVMMFLMLCKAQHLNPFLKEAYLIKYGNNDPATIVVGKDVFTKRARKNTIYKGHEAGVIVLSKDGEITERAGSFKLPEERLVGGWAKVYIEGDAVPQYTSVSLEEYIGRKKDGTVNSQWSKKPATMIKKVALTQALRDAFPEDFGGMYGAEEMGAEVIYDTPASAPVYVDCSGDEERQAVESEVQSEAVATSNQTEITDVDPFA